MFEKRVQKVKDQLCKGRAPPQFREKERPPSPVQPRRRQVSYVVADHGACANRLHSNVIVKSARNKDSQSSEPSGSSSTQSGTKTEQLREKKISFAKKRRNRSLVCILPRITLERYVQGQLDLVQEK
uniref:Uncharacterized protein n=1 Tax=Caenorhabditis japonica TaxID=281687 RepID=A0A8R1E8X5_CAEJA